MNLIFKYWIDYVLIVFRMGIIWGRGKNLCGRGERGIGLGVGGMIEV